MVEIVQNAGGYVFGRKRAASAPAPSEPKEEHTPKPEVVIPKKEKKPRAEKPKAEKPKAEPKIHVIKREHKKKEESDEESKKKA